MRLFFLQKNFLDTLNFKNIISKQFKKKTEFYVWLNQSLLSLLHLKKHALAD